MAAIVWDNPGSRIYESGIDRGVLYVPDDIGVAWNGLTSVDEKSAGSVEALYFDGVKFNDVVTVGEFTGALRAYTYPDEFMQFEGIQEFEHGVHFHDQPQGRFHLSYRTRVSNDLEQQAYKIHLLYNVTAIPAPRKHTTLSAQVDPMEFEWAISAIPETVEGFQPTAHIVIDTRKVDSWLLQDIEEILYGSDTKNPSLPPMQSFINYISKWDRLIIEDHGDGTWSATSQREGQIVMLDGITFQINDANATYLNPTTYEISSTPANEEDLWQP